MFFHRLFLPLMLQFCIDCPLEELIHGHLGLKLFDRPAQLLSEKKLELSFLALS
jgi:hypothetical protein